MEVMRSEPFVTHLIVSLALMGASRKPIRATDLMKSMNVSRSTLSRWISKAEELELVRSVSSKKQQYVMLSEKSIEILKSLKEAIEGIPWEEEVIMGEVFSGMGEGAYYMSREGYVQGFRKLIGYIPYPGTLNLKLGHDDVAKIIDWRRRVTPKVIPGFSEEGRTFGEVEIYPIGINGEIEALAVFPRRRHYGKDVLEVVHEENLRKKLGLRDGDVVSVSLRNW